MIKTILINEGKPDFEKNRILSKIKAEKWPGCLICWLNSFGDFC